MALHKSENYKGVYQRENGTWFYRAKRIVDGKEVYYQHGGFDTDKLAYEARETRLHLAKYDTLKDRNDEDNQEIPSTFGEFFSLFLSDCKSESSRKKYKALYSAQLSRWAEKSISQIKEEDIELFILGLTLQNKSESYISSIRKVIKKFFAYAHSINSLVSAETGQFVSAKPAKLKVLSLFSGIGAPEQALKELKEEMGLNFEVVNYCEFDDKASYAYHLLHGVSIEKDLTDVELVDNEYCRRELPNFDLMVFGSPCQSISSAGKREGFIMKGELPSTTQLYEDDGVEGRLTKSGLIFRALQIILWKKPKFVVAENVSDILEKSYKEDFNAILCNIQDAGYNIYYKKYNSRWFNVPQNRERAFLIMIRDDLNLNYQLPKPIFTREELKDGVVSPIRAEEWFEKEVADEYYLRQPDKAKKAVEEEKSYRPNFNRDYISCLTTGCGQATHGTRQTLIEDDKGIRCLSSEELMRFQGFPPEYGTLLRSKGYTKADVGKLVGNSITVPVIKAIIKSLLQSIIDYRPITGGVIPAQIVEAKIEEKYIDPLFPYYGNKSKLLPYLRRFFPSQNNLQLMTFVDLFSGSGFMALNTPAERVVINEISPFLTGIYKGLSATPPKKAWEKVMEVVRKYSLSADNEDGYYKCREDYNKIPYGERVRDYWFWGLALVYHSYDGLYIRHNKKKEFDSPFGKGHFNFKLAQEKFLPFATKLYESQNIDILCQSFKDFDVDKAPLDEQFFFYVDPPYLTGVASYNKDWSEEDERDLYAYLDKLTRRGDMWMLSNALENNGRRNQILADWLNSSGYRVYFMKRNYTLGKKSEQPTIEVMVINYPFKPL